MNFLTDYEKATGFVHTNNRKLPAFKSEDEFREYVGEHSIDFLQVDFKHREKFLKDNGHAVTRENLLDANLPIKTEE